MKVRIRFASNDLDDKLHAAARVYGKEHDLDFDDALEEVWDKLDAYVVADEYVTVEFDLDNATAQLLTRAAAVANRTKKALPKTATKKK